MILSMLFCSAIFGSEVSDILDTFVLPDFHYIDIQFVKLPMNVNSVCIFQELDGILMTINQDTWAKFTKEEKHTELTNCINSLEK